MKKLIFGMFNIVLVFGLFFVSLYEICFIKQHIDICVVSFQVGNIKKFILEAVWVWGLTSILLLFLFLFIATGTYIFLLFKEEKNPWQRLFSACKKIMVYIWKGIYWKRMWLYMHT